jgi:iron complex transport system substrate-binding protein
MRAKLAILWALLTPQVLASPLPTVVSLNLCTDELVLSVADPEQVLSVTWLVKSAASSELWQRAEHLPANHGTAEEVVALGPDLVVTGEATATPTLAMLKRQNIRVVRLSIPDSIRKVQRQVLLLGRLLGRESHALELVATMRERLRTLPPLPDVARPSAAVYHPNGFTTGAGSLSDEMLTLAGFRNLAAERGLGAYAHYPLELLVVDRPNVLIVDVPGEGASLAQQLLHHPVLDTAGAADGSLHRLALPLQAWSCGTPAVVEAVAQLRAAALAVVNGR